MDVSVPINGDEFQTLMRSGRHMGGLPPEDILP